ncbi:MAG: ribbon-helix-helix protein, CopG family [Dehalococcoidia bacterium]|nr:ribbon-helix-helix protein, CopG family [Dehalococcoidia bacterium]
MKVKTSVSLSEELLAAIDETIGAGGNRSQFIEKALRQQLREIRRAQRNARDREIYASLTPEQLAESDVLDYSIDPLDLGDPVELSDEVLARLDAEARLRAAG